MNEWINVKDILPKDGLRVLFCCEGLKKVLVGHHIKCGLFQFYGNAQYPQNSDPILVDATHWMPLPEPPEL